MQQCVRGQHLQGQLAKAGAFRGSAPRSCLGLVAQRLGLGLEGRVHITGEMLPQRSAQRNLNSVLSGLVQ